MRSCGGAEREKNATEEESVDEGRGVLVGRQVSSRARVPRGRLTLVRQVCVEEEELNTRSCEKAGNRPVDNGAPRRASPEGRERRASTLRFADGPLHRTKTPDPIEIEERGRPKSRTLWNALSDQFFVHVKSEAGRQPSRTSSTTRRITAVPIWRFEAVWKRRNEEK